ARARDARARRPARGADGALRPARLRVPARRRAADELPPSALDAPRAGHGLRRRRRDAQALPDRDRGALPLLLLRRRRADPVSFGLAGTDGGARAGVLHTVHGDVPTPAFMPVGTKGAVRSVDPAELRELGTSILLGNTYHLHFRPGDELVADGGGLHAF